MFPRWIRRGESDLVTARNKTHGKDSEIPSACFGKTMLQVLLVVFWGLLVLHLVSLTSTLSIRQLVVSSSLAVRGTLVWLIFVTHLSSFRFVQRHGVTNFTSINTEAEVQYFFHVEPLRLTITSFQQPSYLLLCVELIAMSSGYSGSYVHVHPRCRTWDLPPQGSYSFAKLSSRWQFEQITENWWLQLFSHFQE